VLRITDYRYRVLAALGKFIIRCIEISMRTFLPNKSYFAPAEFVWTKSVDAQWKNILNEVIDARNKPNGMYDICDISPEQYKVVDRGEWDFYPLYAYGVPFLDNLASCPKTANILEVIPYKTTVFFSILKPGTHVKAHRGAYRGYLRYHLGLSVPEPEKCGLKLIDKTYHWKDGESMVFDDTFDHEAWNNGNEDRIILYVDFIRPMPKFFKFVSLKLTKMISQSPFVQRGLERAGQID